MRTVIAALFFLSSLGLLGYFESSDEAGQSLAAANNAAVSYTKDVQPILSASCYDCHNAKKKKGGIDLQSSFAGVQKIVSPAKPDESRLFKCLVGKGAKLMPPKNPLPQTQIATIRAWIADGAKEK